MKQKIILASTSPRRQELAKQMGLEFEVVPSDYAEDMTLSLSPEDLAMTLSYGKAKSVAKDRIEGIVIGIDTFIVYRGIKIGKPHTAKKARQILKSFSGKTIQVYSGIAFIDCSTGKEIKDYEITEVTFKKLTESEITHYVISGEPLDKGGSFAIQGLGSVFIERVKGCYANVVGFPINNVYRNLKKMRVNIFEYSPWKGECD